MRGHEFKSPVVFFEKEKRTVEFNYNIVLAARTNIEGGDQVFDNKLTLFEV